MIDGEQATRWGTRDGHEVAVEFHLTRDSAGPGRHLSVMREIPFEAAAPSAEGEAETVESRGPEPATG